MALNYKLCSVSSIESFFCVKCRLVDLSDHSNLHKKIYGTLNKMSIGHSIDSLPNLALPFNSLVTQAGGQSIHAVESCRPLRPIQQRVKWWVQRWKCSDAWSMLLQSTAPEAPLLPHHLPSLHLASFWQDFALCLCMPPLSAGPAITNTIFHK
jgi:hypothetical protein